MKEQDALALLDELLELDAAARAERLARIAGEDAALAALLHQWLAADGRRDDRLDHGPVATRVLPHEAPVRAAAGDRVGAFRLVRELGRGGMGQVWLAERADGEFAQQVALKLIHPEVAGPEAAPRFRRERQILAGLRHPNIAQLIDGGVTPDGRPWLAMEWVAGVSLREELRRGALPLRRVLAIGAQIAEALAHAHAAGVVHRDLKPENVLATPEGYAKVLDFGIAKLLGSEEATTTVSATQPGLLLGTVAYMSPEQASGAAVDFRSDQFALGALLYELATGRAAFMRDTQRATLSAVLNAEPAGVWEEDREIALPESLARVLRRCLAKEPADRYAATLDLAHDLKALASGALSGPVAGTRRRRRFAAPLAFALGAALAGAIAAASWTLRPAPQIGAVAEAPLRLRAQIPLAPAARLNFGTFAMHVMGLSPDGRTLVFSGTVDGKRQLLLRRLDEPTSSVLPGGEGGQNPVFSPDGEWIAFFANQKLKKIPVAGGGDVVLAEAPNALGGIAWDRPDRILYSPHPSTGIFASDANGGEPVQLTFPDPSQGEAGHLWPCGVPGTDLFLYVAEMDAADSFDGGRIYAYDAASQRRSLLVEGGSDPSLVGDMLHYVRGGTIYAVRLDDSRRALVGAPRPVREGVMYSPAMGAAQFIAHPRLRLHVEGQEGQDRMEPVWVDRHGKAEPLGLPPAHYDRVRLSPDGRRLALQITAADDDLWVYDFERRTLSRVTDREENFMPAWMPDSQWLVFSHNGTPAPPPPTLARRRADGGGSTEELLPPAGELQARLYADVSPDGRSIAYAQYSVEHNFDIYLLDMETRRSRLLLQTPDSDIFPRFSPDGRWFAWHTAARLTDVGQVFVQAVEGEGRRWQVSTEGGVAPIWRRDGRGLFFLRLGSVYEVEFAQGDDLAPSSPRLLFSGDYTNRFDVSPDGQRFLMLRRVPDPGAAGPIHVETLVPGP